MAKNVIDQDEKQEGFSLKKVFIFIAIICLPLVVIMVVFAPLTKNKTVALELAQYVLPEEFAEDSVNSIVNKMKADREFAFYFQNLNNQEIEKISSEVYVLLSANKGKEKLREAVKVTHASAESFAALYYNLDYDAEFFKSPEQFPELYKVLRQFLYEEFKSTVLGLIYKATYSEGFVFEWSYESVLAARKLKDDLTKIADAVVRPQ